MKAAESSWLAFGFALTYLASWLLLRFLLLDRPIAHGLAGIAVLSMLYLLFIFVVRPRAPWNSRRFAGCLLLVAVFSRLALFDVPPETLSDDVYRYVWDGKVQVHGINPYRFAPAAEELTQLREPFHAKINHPFHQTIYPPVAELLFALAYLLSGSKLLGLRIIYLGCDLLSAWWILKIIEGTAVSGFGLRASGSNGSGKDRASSGFRNEPGLLGSLGGTGRSNVFGDSVWEKVGSQDGLVFLYLLSPLLVIETYVGMHVDVAGMAFLLGAYRYLGDRAKHRALALLVAAVLVKYIALAALPVFILLIIRDRRRKGFRALAMELLQCGIWSLLVAICLFAPYLSAGGDIFRSLLDYARFMDFNSPVHTALVHSAGAQAPILRGVVLLMLMGYILSACASAPVKIGWAVTVFVLTGPAVFPWYLLYLVPFGALEWTLGGLALTTLPLLSYLVLVEFHASGVWRESHWVRFPEYLPVLACLALDVWRRWCTGKRK